MLMLAMVTSGRWWIHLVKYTLYLRRRDEMYKPMMPPMIQDTTSRVMRCTVQRRPLEAGTLRRGQWCWTQRSMVASSRRASSSRGNASQIRDIQSMRAALSAGSGETCRNLARSTPTRLSACPALSGIVASMP